MLKKTYTCDVIDCKNSSVLCGSVTVRIWFFSSPSLAYQKISDDLSALSKENEGSFRPVNFRRVN